MLDNIHGTSLNVRSKPSADGEWKDLTLGSIPMVKTVSIGTGYENTCRKETTMKRMTALILAIMAITGSMAILSLTHAPARADTDETLSLIWEDLNETRSSVSFLIMKLNQTQVDLGIANGKLNGVISSVNIIKNSLGYNDSDPEIYNIKSDFTLLYQALYSTDGSSNLKLLNDNQVILGNKSDTMSGKITDTAAAINAHTTDQVGSLNFNMMVVIVMICLFIAGIIIFMVSSYRGKNSIKEMKAPAESLFVPQLQAQPQQTVEQIVDGMPNCFKKMYNGNSNDCKACGVRSECSGRFVKRTPQ